MSDTSKTPDYLKASAKVLLSKLEKGEKLMTSYPYPLQVWKLG
jgi:neutral ceramidase